MEEYTRMVELKTAILIAGALKIGAILGGAGDKEIECIYAFGRSLGLAFQVQDDILDAYGDPRVFGKSRGGDIIANKKTVLLIKALELASGETLKRLQDILSQKDFDPETKVAAVMAIYGELDIRSHAEKMANSYIDQAFDSFEKLEISSSRKEPLHNLASELVGRSR